MGLLVNGQWQDTWYETKSTQGDFKREQSKLRHWITTGEDSQSKKQPLFLAEPGRYHLYVSLACPWAHRTLIFLKLKKLEDIISVSVVSPDMLSFGWSFDKDSGSTGDLLNHFEFMHQVYTLNDPNYTGRVTVPVLWDKKTNTIVNNESSEIIRMLNMAFNAFTEVKTDYYPENLKESIDKINDFVYENVNNGVYRCGFATTQEAYEKAYHALFGALDEIEIMLSKNRYLVGNSITETDWRLFTTLIRFDVVYFGHFKCNKKRLEDYPNMINYVRELYQWPGIAETVSFEQIKKHYYFSHTMINPTQIVPVGPDVDYTQSHYRDNL